MGRLRTSKMYLVAKEIDSHMEDLVDAQFLLEKCTYMTTIDNFTRTTQCGFLIWALLLHQFHDMKMCVFDT